MKIIRYILLVIFTVIFAWGLAIDITIFLFGGFLGNGPELIIFPVHFILGIILFVIYIRHTLGKKPLSPAAEVFLTLLLAIILISPIVVGIFQNTSDQKYKDTQEETCTITQIQQYKYKVCASGFTPLDVCSDYGSPECIRAVKVWDQNH